MSSFVINKTPQNFSGLKYLGKLFGLFDSMMMTNGPWFHPHKLKEFQ